MDDPIHVRADGRDDATEEPALDERGLRRPGWSAGRWVELDDGQRGRTRQPHLQMPWNMFNN